MYKLLRNPEKREVRLFADPFEDRHSKEETLPIWGGTVVGIDLSLSTAPDFEHLLGLINKVYEKDLRERKKEFYKKAKFI